MSEKKRLVDFAMVRPLLPKTRGDKPNKSAESKVKKRNENEIRIQKYGQVGE